MNEIESTIDYIKTNYEKLNIGIDYSNGKDHTTITLFDKQAELVIKTLQEKLEREKGCEYCNKEKNSDINVDGRRIGQAYLHECSNGYAMFLYLCGNTETYYVDAEYCPHCGRKLGGENV